MIEPCVQVLEFTDGTLSPERLEDLFKVLQPAGSPASSFPPKVLSGPMDRSLSSKPGFLYVTRSCHRHRTHIPHCWAECFAHNSVLTMLPAPTTKVNQDHIAQPGFKLSMTLNL